MRVYRANYIENAIRNSITVRVYHRLNMELDLGLLCTAALIG
jgi:hypothetical protein